MENVKTNDNWVIWGSFFFLTLAWGSSFILIKRGLTAFSPDQVASLRLSAGMLALIPLGLQHARRVPPDRLKYIFLSGMLGLFIPAFLFALAQKGVSSSIAGVVNAFTPCMTFIIGIAFFKQAPTLMKIVGLLIGFVGTALLVLINSTGQIHLNGYAFCLIGATVCYGFNLNLVKRHLSGVKAIYLSTISISMVGFMAFAYLLTTNWLQNAQNAPNGWNALGACLTLGLLGTAAAQTVFNRLLHVTSAVFASSITYFIPIVAVMWGVLDGEILSFWHYVGMVLILVGIVILTKFR